MVSIFLIFGIGVQIVLLSFVAYILYRIYKFLQKRKKWGKDVDGLAWARAVLDPDGPTRVTPDTAKKYRFKTATTQKPEK